MNVVSNKVLNANEFIENVTGQYYLRCDTLNEMLTCYWDGTGTPMSRYWTLTEANKIPSNAYVVIVRVSSENNYTEYEDYFIRIPKKYVSRFMKNMEENIK